MTSVKAPVAPDPEAKAAAGEALARVRDLLAHDREPQVALVADKERREPLVIPRPVVELLARILDHLANGAAVSVVPTHAELGTEEAATLLNVSRPFLVDKLLDTGRIAYRMVGNRRRVDAQSLLAYLADDEPRRRQVADELTALNQEMGLL